MKILLVLCGVLVLVLAACATTNHIVSVGDGTYAATVHIRPYYSGERGAVVALQNKANDFCAGKGGHAVPVINKQRESEQGSVNALRNQKTGQLNGVTFKGQSAVLQFKCEQ